MKVQIVKELNDNVYSATLNILEPEIGNYMAAVHDFGEEPINFGGQILDTDNSTVLATLSDRYIKVTEIISSPVSQTFSFDQYGSNVEKIANQWVNGCVNSISAYVKEVSAKVDGFSGVQVVDV